MMQAKIKKSKTKKSKGCVCETPLAEIFFFSPATAPENSLIAVRC
jgi:hypothetical protein